MEPEVAAWSEFKRAALGRLRGRPALEQGNRLHVCRRDFTAGWEGRSSVRPAGHLEVRQQAFDAGVLARARHLRFCTARGALSGLSPAERVELFAEYCLGCGKLDPSCPCMRED